MSARRLLATETLDPNGQLPQWITPAIRRLGWQAWTLPTVEAAQMLGLATYAAMVVRIVDELRPHVLLVHPPYDHLPPPACRRIRDCGTLIVGLAFDDPLYWHSWGQTELSDLRQRFDLWATTAAAGPTVRAGARPVRWVMAPESVAIDDPAAPTHEAVLIGRYTETRQATARAVAKAGIKIACFGDGWATGPVTRPSRLGLMRRAQVVITPSDGTDFAPLLMTEAALLGVPQIIEYAPGLERYLSEADPPATYVTAEDCAARLAEGGPLPAWTGVPTWEESWPELLAGLTFADQPERHQSPTLEMLYAALAHFYGQRNQSLVATACLVAWAQAAPEDPGAKIGLARQAHAARRWQDTVRLTSEAEHLLGPYVAPAVANLKVFIPDARRNLHLAESGALDPSLDLVALRLNALLMDHKIDQALDEVKDMSSDRRRAVLAAIYPNTDAPELDRLLKALSEG